MSEPEVSRKTKKCDRVIEQSCKAYVAQLQRMFPDARVTFKVYGIVSWWDGSIPTVEMAWQPMRYQEADEIFHSLPEHWDEEAKQQLRESKYAYAWEESINA